MVNFRTAFKLISVMIITLVVVFICTIFVNYSLDLGAIEYLMTSPEMQTVFYDAQVSLTNVIILATVGLLGGIAVLILMFSIRQFINENSAELGILKALGYSESRIALDFSKFGLSVFAGSILGYLAAYIASPAFYNMLTSNVPLPVDIVFGFHARVFFIMVITPALFFGAVAVLYARLRLAKKPLDLITGSDQYKVNKLTRKIQGKGSGLPFLHELKRNMLFNNVLLIFFIGFAAFAFATQIQMAFTMHQLMQDTVMMSTFVIIGLISGSVTLLLSLTFIIGANKKYITLLKAYGYTERECAKAMFGGYRIVTYIGFAIGTIYQYVLIAFVIARAFESVSVDFSIIGLLVTLPTFIIAYEIIMLIYKQRITRIPLREVMQA